MVKFLKKHWMDILVLAAVAVLLVMGASTISAEQFYCKSLDAEISGASKATLKGDRARVDVAGASKATIECNELLSASSSGASTLHYTGDCTVSIENNSGASTIKKR